MLAMLISDDGSISDNKVMVNEISALMEPAVMVVVLIIMWR